MRECDLNLRALLSRRGAAVAVLLLAVVAAGVISSRLLGARVGNTMQGLEDARPVWLWVAAFAFVGALLCASAAWRSALALADGRLSRTDAAARYGIGSLVNSLSPARIGEAVRAALFAQGLDGEDRAWRMGGVFAVITALRSSVFALVVVAAAATGAVPLWPVVILAGFAICAGVVALVVRDRTPRTHVAHLLDAFRELGRSPAGGARIVGWMALGTGLRFVGATAIAASLGVHSPVSAALIILPTLDLAGLIPLSANFGVTSGAVVVALKAHGVALSSALATGLAFHVVETAAGVSFGLAAALLLAPLGAPAARRRLIVLAGVGSIACIVAGFAATVVVPLA